MSEKSKGQVREFATMVARKQGWVLNPDLSFLDILVDGLTVNSNRYGYFLCPCRDTEGSRLADMDVICPCKFSWADISEFGHCYCALYLSASFAATGRPTQGIPDRRFTAE